MNNTIRSTLSRYSIDGFWLKIIALLFMTMDHIGEYIFDVGIGFSPLRILGRIAAPLFLYGVVNSARYTRNKTKLIIRLYSAHVLICLSILFLGKIMPAYFGGHDQFSILSTFVYVVVFIKISENTAKAAKIGKWSLFARNIGLMALIIIVPIILMFTSHYDSIISIFCLIF